MIVGLFGEIAKAINKDYPTMYQATANAVGVTVVALRPMSIYHAAAFLENCACVKGHGLKVAALEKFGIITIRR